MAEDHKIAMNLILPEDCPLNPDRIAENVVDAWLESIGAADPYVHDNSSMEKLKWMIRKTIIHANNMGRAQQRARGEDV